MQKVKSGSIAYDGTFESLQEDWKKEGRYGMLNQMMSLSAKQDVRGLYEKMREYEQMNRMTENLFSVIK